MILWAVKFKYRDECSRGRFRTQIGYFYAVNMVNAIENCIAFYGLDKCECELIYAVPAENCDN